MKGNEMNSVILKNFDNPESRIIKDLSKLKEVIDSCKKLGAKITMTMGVFDLIHIGHVKYLEKAKEEGDIFVVAVDSDSLTKSRKGPTRPLVPEEERLQMICRFADIVTINDISEDPNYLLDLVRPDVLTVSVTTSDYKTRYQDLEKYVGRVNRLEPQAETSTTARIRKIMIDGKGEIVKDLLEVIEKHKNDPK